MKVAMVVVVWLALLCPQGREALTLWGVGTPWASDIFTTWGQDYGFSEDDVSFVYVPSSTVQAGLTSMSQSFVSYVATPALIPEYEGSSMNYSIPMFGSAMTATFNHTLFPNSSASVASNMLTFDESTLIALFSGDLYSWSDSRLQALNPFVALPPSTNITLVICNDSLGEGNVLARYLSSASPALSSIISANGGSIALLPPVVQGRAKFSCTTAGKEAALAQSGWGASLVFMMLPEALSTSSTGLLPIAFMQNGTRLVASQTSVSQAMTTATAANASSSNTELINRGGTAWPMSTLVYILVATDTAKVECTLVKELLTFATWTQVNDAAVSALSGLGPYSALNPVLRKRMLDQLANITCKGQQALTSVYLVGQGPLVPTYDSWATDYQSSSFRLKYYDTGSVSASALMAEDAVDFGVAVLPLTAAQQEALPDVMLVPSLLLAYNFVYNIPELADAPMTLLIDFQTASDIFLNKIQTWDHPNISALNPEIAHMLPNTSILVAYNSVPQGLTYLYTYTLSLAVPEFRERVGFGTYVNLPVVTEDPARTVACASLDILVNVLSLTPYVFAGGVSYAAQLIPGVQQAAMINPAGYRVEALPESILAAVANAPDPLALQILLAPGNNSWPMVSYTSFMIRTRSFTDCNKAQAMVDWMYWTQTSTTASDIALADNIYVASQSSLLLSRMLNILSNVTCYGQHVGSIYGCVSDGQLCFNRGTCVSNQCSCNPGYAGEFCQSLSSGSSSSSAILAPVLGTVLPVGVLLFLLLLAVVVVLSRRNGKGDDWEIIFEELEMGDVLGEGGYGTVHKATWKGSEVAVKMMTRETVNKAMIAGFVEEARTMSHLRHPNVVLFMAACTKPPKMCIVMEYMALGSLYDLLHNELIPDIPMPLKVKIVFQAAKGMQFLHSSGIVHRDLKSLNLLLDSKWNVKVSDFGLTRFKNSIKSNTKNGGHEQLVGSVPWMAPEVLEESSEIDHSLADVYSFGIIMWEVLTREQPYNGMLPAQIAVAVIRNDLRPLIHSEQEIEEQGIYVNLMSTCWHRDPTLRPVFSDVMKQLQSMIETLSTTSGFFTSTSGGSSSSHGGINQHHPSHNSRNPWANGGPDGQSSTRSGSTNRSGYGGSDSVPMSSGHLAKHQAGRGSVAPRREVCFVVCDLARCNESWQANAAGTAKAISHYGQLVRDLSFDISWPLGKEEEAGEALDGGKKDASKPRVMSWQGTSTTPAVNGGYLFSRPSLHSGGTFMLAFADADKAAWFALQLQRQVAQRSWPSNVELLSRVSLHHEAGISSAPHQDASRTGYDPKHYAEACRLNLRSRPGEVVCSAAFKLRVSATGNPDLVRRLRWKAQGADQDSFYLHEIGFGSRGGEKGKGSNDQGEDEDDYEDEGEVEEDEPKWDQGMGLCSSNWCPWIINKENITMGTAIGEGNFGRVLAGTYYGSPVAVKLLYKSRLDDAALIKMRKEAAILSNVDHPNVVKLIGLSVGSDGNLMLIMEQVERGDLRGLLSDSSTKLTWQRKVTMLRDAALGLAFLHSRGILHRDIKSSNLLVEKSMTVKVGDFGFATAKQDNGTQTRCGTPSWTAPEIISGTVKYTEKADVYSFGIVMWEVLTRKVPYQDKNMMTVALDVINGQRPTVPGDCPKAFAEVMQRCWTANPKKRASMADIIAYLNSEVDAGVDV